MEWNHKAVADTDGRASAEQSEGQSTTGEDARATNTSEDARGTNAGGDACATGEKKSAGGSDSDEDAETSALKEWVGLLVRAGLWAAVIYLLLFQVSKVEQESMVPTFHDGDKLVIDKLTYRFSPVKRGDVVVFEAVDADKLPRRSRDYIKRIVGLPGEEVSIKDGAVWIGGAKLEESNGPTYASKRAGEAAQTILVPPHHYFVMGDNRGASKDSRVDGRQTLGFVAEAQIRGLVRLRFWPLSDFKWFSRGR